MRVLVAFTVCFMLMYSAVQAQDKPTKGNILSKKFSDDVELDGIDLNKSGDKAVLTFEDQFWGVSVIDGKTLWTKKLDDDYDDKWDVIRWVNDSIVTIPTATSLEWVNGSTGAVVGSVKFPGDGLDAMTKKNSKDGKTDNIRVRRFGPLMIIPFNDQYQVINLHKMSLVYESTDELSDPRYHLWGPTLMIGGTMDTVAVFDLVEGKLLYKQDMDDLKFDPEIFQTLIRYKDHAVLIFDENVILVNVATGKQIANLELSIKDLETYEPLILDGTLHLLLQSDEDLSLMRVADGKVLWKKGANEESYGHTIHAWPLSSTDVLVTTTNPDDDIYVRRISGKDGKLLWSTRLVRSDDSFEQGIYHNPPTLGMTLNPRVMFNSATSWIRTYQLDSVGLPSYYEQLGIDSIGPYTDEDYMARLSIDCIHELADGAGIARYVGSHNGDITMVTQGLVYKAWDGKISEGEADGEAVISINPTTGKINKVTPVAFTRNTEGTEKKNLYQFYTPIRNAYGTSIMGSQTMTFIRQDGGVDSLRFPADDEGMYQLGSGYDYRVMYYEDMNDHFVLWKILFSPNGMKRQLVGYADEKKHLAVFSDTLLTNVTLRYEGGTLYAYEAMFEMPKTWPKPLWTLNDDALDDLNIGDFEATATRNDVIGIHPHKDHVLILGTEGCAFIGAKDGCKKVIPWDGWVEKQSFTRDLRLFEPMNGGYLFDLGPSAGVIKENGTCDVSLVAFKEDSPNDLRIVFSKLTSRIVMINVSDNTIDIFQLNK